MEIYFYFIIYDILLRPICLIISILQQRVWAAYNLREHCHSLAFSALTLLVGWQEGHPACKKTEWWDVGVVVCVRGVDLHMAQQMPLPLTISCSSKSRLVLTFLVLPFWYLLTRVVPDIFQKSSKMVVYCHSKTN